MKVNAICRYALVLLANVALASTLEAQRGAGTNSALNRAPDARLALARKLTVIMRVAGGIGLVNRPPLMEPPVPPSGPYREVTLVTRRWAERYMPKDSLAEVEARAIAKEFNESELRELLSFFSSPLGRRIVEAQPRLARAVTTETQRIMALHRQELMDSVRSIPPPGRAP